jgi:hypothetical protein
VIKYFLWVSNFKKTTIEEEAFKREEIISIDKEKVVEEALIKDPLLLLSLTVPLCTVHKIILLLNVQILPEFPNLIEASIWRQKQN